MCGPVKLGDRVRTRHDEWTKDALELWLGQLGKVQLDARIAGSVRRGDILFTEEKPKRYRRKLLGLLGELARGSVLFEPFRNPVTAWEIETCLVKIIEHTAYKQRIARRAKQNQSTVEHTLLCVITPSMSAELKKTAELTLLFPDKPGVYRMAPLLHALVIVVNELPEDRSTLWLRLLGRAEVQLRAAMELGEMRGDKQLRDATLHLLTAWYQSLPQALVIGSEQDATMNWRRVYAKWERETLKKGRAEGLAEGKAEGLAEGKAEGLAEGKAEGLAEGKAESVIFVLSVRGLPMTVTQRKQILACKDLARLDQWLLASHFVADVKDLFAPGPSTRRRTQRRAA